MNAFAQIIQACSAPRTYRGQNKTQTVRDHLMKVKRADASELAGVAEVGSNRIRALLKHDIDNGRVRMTGERGTRLYWIVENPPPDAPTLAAIRHLTTRGYTVLGPQLEN